MRSPRSIRPRNSVHESLIIGGDSSEKLTKEFRRPLSSNAKIEEFSGFSMPDKSVLQCYIRKFPNFLESNTPFFEYEPTQEEIDRNKRIETQLMEQIEKDKKSKKGTIRTDVNVRGRSIYFHGEPGPSGISNQNEAENHQRYDSIEAAVEAGMAEGDQEVADDEDEDSIIQEFIRDQLAENANNEQEIEFVGHDGDGNHVDPIYEFLDNEENEIDARYINLIPENRQKRIRKRPSRFDDFDLD